MRGRAAQALAPRVIYRARFSIDLFCQGKILVAVLKNLICYRVYGNHDVLLNDDDAGQNSFGYIVRFGIAADGVNIPSFPGDHFKDVNAYGFHGRP